LVDYVAYIGDKFQRAKCFPLPGHAVQKKEETSGTTWPWTWRRYDHSKLT